MSFDMNQCKKGDKLVCRNGDVVVYDEKTCYHRYPHKVNHTSGYISYTEEGLILTSSTIQDYDIIGFYKEETSMDNKQYEIKLKQGDACKIQGLTEEQYHEVCKRFIDSGADDGNYKAQTFKAWSNDYSCLEWYSECLCPTTLEELESNATLYTYEEIMKESMSYTLADGTLSTEYEAGDEFIVIKEGHFEEGTVVQYTGHSGPHTATAQVLYPNGGSRFGYDWTCWENLAKYKDEKKMLERDKEYDIKLTGEELAILLLLTGSTTGLRVKTEVFMRLDALFKHNPSTDEYNVCWVQDLAYNRHMVDDWLNTVFTKPETEQEKKLREMEEQYEALGRAIEQARNDG